MNGTYLTGPIFGDAAVASIFADPATTDRLVRVEAVLAQVQAQLGIIPQAASDAIAAATSGLNIPSDTLRAGVAATGVPVPALVATLCDAVPAPHNDWVHWGATSQDIIDCERTLAVAACLDLFEARLASLLDSLERLSRFHAATVMAGRTRTQLATPITFGLRVANWAQPCIALENELSDLRALALRVQFGGASGAQTAIAPHGPAIADGLALALDLTAGVPWHTDRSPVRHVVFWASRLIAAIAKLATDTIISSRSEIGEVTAGVAGGSSTMPQKANPVTSEAILSIATVARAVEGGLTESAVHAEERDGSSWSAEWLLLPQLLECAGAALNHANRLIDTMLADTDAMAARLRDNPEVSAEAAVFALAAEHGRIKAQALVKEALANKKSLSDLAGPAIDPHNVVEPSAAIIDAIFAGRTKTPS